MDIRALDQAVETAKVVVSSYDGLFPSEETAEIVATFIETLAERLDVLYEQIDE